MKTISDLVEYLNKCEKYNMSIKDALLSFLQHNPDILAWLYTDLSNLTYTKMCDLQHYCKIKDENLGFVRNWITGDKQRHTEEYKDLMLDNIDRALNCEKE